MNKEILASYIDHTLLKPEATKRDIKRLCDEAMEYGFASVCVNPYYVSYARKCIGGHNVKVCGVLGFPLGSTTCDVKAVEASEMIKNGADEIDMVLNIGALKEGSFGYVKEDIKAVVAACENRALVKVIIETCLLNKDEIVKACKLAKEANADFVKTSTGFSTGGAKVEDIVLMKSVIGNRMGLKASGGIRDAKTCLEMIDVGATRIGASASVKIINEIE